MRFFRSRAFAPPTASRSRCTSASSARSSCSPSSSRSRRALAAGGRPAHAAVDGHADVRRADRGPALGPHRLTAADVHRPRAAGGRDRLARRRSRRPTVALRRVRDPVRARRHRHGARVRPDRQRGAERRAPEEAGQASGATNAIREVGGTLGVAVLASVFAANGSYASPQAFTDGLTQRGLGRRRGARRRRADRPAGARQAARARRGSGRRAGRGRVVERAHLREDGVGRGLLLVARRRLDALVGERLAVVDADLRELQRASSCARARSR